MKVLGIIAEYNPFHNGHLYQLEKSIDAIKPDFTIAIISGNFTQRGEAAFASKWIRSKAAVKCGIDLVIELPFVYACNNAEYFAKGAIKILNGLGCVTHISFGSECGDINALTQVAKLLADEPQPFKEALKQHLSEGLSYPKAREKAISQCLEDQYSDLATSPNNILAIEYLKQLYLTNSDIKPFTVQRFIADYHDTKLSGHIASATAIRKFFHTDDINKFMPKASFETFQSADTSCCTDNILYTLMCSKILTTPAKDLANIFSVREGLENKIKEEVRFTKNLSELQTKLVSKRYTQTRINRTLIHILFGLTTEKMHEADKETPYARILSFNENGAKLIKHMKKNKLNEIPLITNVNKESEYLSTSKLLFSFDTASSDLFNLITSNDLYKGSDFVNKPFIQKNFGKIT